MKRILLSLIAILIFKTGFAQNINPDTTYLKYVKSIAVSSDDFNTLLPLIVAPGKSDEEKLTLVYYWVYDHITFDTDRFLKTGPMQPLNLTEALKSGQGLCFEYNEFIDVACKYLKIPGYNIEGYVKYYGFTAGQSFTENNHIWYTVYIDGKWKMLDLLWACGSLSIKDGNYTFKKKLHKEYFLVNPANFSETHLPADPVWQFTDHPLAMSGFISKKDGIDSSQRYSYINYADSIIAMNKLTNRDKELRSAIRGYNFNPSNPNQLIVIYYNDAVALVNNVKATKSELIKAKSYFTQSKLLIPKSKDTGIEALAPVCEKAIQSIDGRLKYIKS